MKLVTIIGNSAVGKMTVGQELAKITDLRLFHNHMPIELVLEVFRKMNGQAVKRIRDVVFEEFAKTENYGMIFTYMMAFDVQSEWDYLEHVRSIFAPYGCEFYYVELVAPQKVRLERNCTENRLKNKASKRDVEISDRRLIGDDEKYRLESYDGEFKYDNYMKIDNSDISAAETAKMIKEHFSL